MDSLLLRLHTETACRRGGALALRPVDLDPDPCLILLREKGETVRWQPVSPTLMRYLLRHAEQRHATETGPLLRYRSGQPITYRRYDHVWVRIGEHLPWVHAQQISTHWLRHTTLTWVERQLRLRHRPGLCRSLRQWGRCRNHRYLRTRNHPRGSCRAGGTHR
ncbi:site-specific integrase [Micromonospora purpureochromogenes]|uniref:site-specific integrase n=1 Tax=Micromonospora purpureochromogenes TaxID=47872 RepID=UPI00332DB722